MALMFTNGCVAVSCDCHIRPAPVIPSHIRFSVLPSTMTTYTAPGGAFSSCRLSPVSSLPMILHINIQYCCARKEQNAVPNMVSSIQASQPLKFGCCLLLLLYGSISRTWGCYDILCRVSVVVVIVCELYFGMWTTRIVLAEDTTNLNQQSGMPVHIIVAELPSYATLLINSLRLQGCRCCSCYICCPNILPLASVLE